MKFNFNKNNKQPIGDGTAVLIDSVGSPQEIVFRVIKEVNKEEIIIELSNKETFQIKKAHIRAKRIIIYKLSTGKIITQNPNDWAKINLENQGIKELRFNLQNFGLQESKAAQSRWTVPLTKMEKLIPLFKLLFICVAVGVIGWSAFKYGVYLFDKISASSIIDCASLISKTPTPVGGIELINKTIPIGAIG